MHCRMWRQVPRTPIVWIKPYSTFVRSVVQAPMHASQLGRKTCHKGFSGSWRAAQKPRNMSSILPRQRMVYDVGELKFTHGKPGHLREEAQASF